MNTKTCIGKCVAVVTFCFSFGLQAGDFPREIWELIFSYLTYDTRYRLKQISSEFNRWIQIPQFHKVDWQEPRNESIQTPIIQGNQVSYQNELIWDKWDESDWYKWSHQEKNILYIHSNRWKAKSIRMFIFDLEKPEDKLISNKAILDFNGLDTPLYGFMLTRAFNKILAIRYDSVDMNERFLGILEEREEGWQFQPLLSLGHNAALVRLAATKRYMAVQVQKKIYLIDPYTLEPMHCVKTPEGYGCLCYEAPMRGLVFSDRVQQERWILPNVDWY